MLLNIIDEHNQLIENDYQLIQNILDFSQKKLINKFPKLKEETVMSVTFVSDLEIKDINNAYRNIDKVTDVISFGINENSNSDLEDPFLKNLDLIQEYDLGDSIISLEQIIRQAQLLNQSRNDELAYVLVHSLLHLLGFDHLKEEEEKEMFSLQKEILKEIKKEILPNEN